MSLPSPIVVNMRSGADYDEYIGLGSHWGNRFAYASGWKSAYEKQLRERLKDPGWRVELKALSGKRLGCHCAPRPCHGDIIVKLFLELWGPNGKIESEGSKDPCVGKSGRLAEDGSCA